MSVTEAIGAIRDIQGRLDELFGATATAPKAVATTPASSFTQALASAQGAAGQTVANPSGASGSDVVAAASKYLGVPYVFGGEDASGMDCSGLVQRAFADLGVAVPRVVQDQAKIGTPVASLAEAKPGDLISLDGESHIVIYLGNNKVLHAPSEGRTVTIQDVWFSPSQIDTIRRVLPSNSPVGGVGDLLSAAQARLVSGGVL